MTRAIFTWSGFTLAGLVAVVVALVAVATAADRPGREPVTVDYRTPAVAAYLEAERAWMAYHGLEYTEHLVEVPEHGLQVRVLEVGDGAPVLFLPPAPGEAARFAPLLAELDSGRGLLVNLPGGGASDGIDLRAVEHRRLARNTLDAVYDHFNLDAAPVIGGSIGGTWALWYSLDRPARVTAGAQLGVPPGLEGTSVPLQLSALGVPGVNHIVTSILMPVAEPGDAGQAFEQAFGHPDGTAGSLPLPGLEYEYALQQLPTFQLTWRTLGQDAFSLGGLAGWDDEVAIGLDELRRISHPTMLVWPANDPFGDVDLGREIAGHLPDGRLHVAGVGHLPWLDHPEGVAELVAGFLADGFAGGSGRD